ncbi:MAG: hypothetical protein ACOVQ0_06645 [Novosphingobium sp.]|uniref:hypothetical protein n=1 Tax=Novosphingobium sp. TaxID=1874826 RepID=UPI003B99830F
MTLDDLLEGQSPADVAAVQKHILGLGGALKDPAYVPVAAALLINLKTRRAIVETARGVGQAAAAEATKLSISAIEQAVPPLLQRLAKKASETPLTEVTRRVTALWLLLALSIAMSAGFALAGIVGYRTMVEVIPPEIATFQANGNSLAWLTCDPTRVQVFAKENGRRYCDAKFWMEPSLKPGEEGSKVATTTVKQGFLPIWIQWGAWVVLVVVAFGATLSGIFGGLGEPGEGEEKMPMGVRLGIAIGGMFGLWSLIGLVW